MKGGRKLLTIDNLKYFGQRKAVEEKRWAPSVTLAAGCLREIFLCDETIAAGTTLRELMPGIATPGLPSCCFSPILSQQAFFKGLPPKQVDQNVLVESHRMGSDSPAPNLHSQAGLTKQRLLQQRPNRRHRIEVEYMRQAIIVCGPYPSQCLFLKSSSQAGLVHPRSLSLVALLSLLQSDHAHWNAACCASVVFQRTPSNRWQPLCHKLWAWEN